jgi:hypothetical protein
MSCDNIIQGTTGPIWHVTVPEVDNDGLDTGNDADLTNYTCSIKVGDQTQSITRKNTLVTSFLVQLSSATTALLDAGGYNLGIEVRDDTVSPPYVSEIHKQIKIKTQRV